MIKKLFGPSLGVALILLISTLVQLIIYTRENQRLRGQIRATESEFKGVRVTQKGIRVTQQVNPSFTQRERANAKKQTVSETTETDPAKPEGARPQPAGDPVINQMEQVLAMQDKLYDFEYISIKSRKLWRQYWEKIENGQDAQQPPTYEQMLADALAEYLGLSHDKRTQLRVLLKELYQTRYRLAKEQGKPFSKEGWELIKKAIKQITLMLQKGNLLHDYFIYNIDELIDLVSYNPIVVSNWYLPRRLWDRRY
jgi:hypothetical protein